MTKQEQFEHLLQLAGIDNTASIEVVAYVGNFPDAIHLWEGDIINLFKDYVSVNDRLRYINGSYYKFRDILIEEAYQFYVKNLYKGNIYLDSAVERGVLID